MDSALSALARDMARDVSHLWEAPPTVAKFLEFGVESAREQARYESQVAAFGLAASCDRAATAGPMRAAACAARAAACAAFPRLSARSSLYAAEATAAAAAAAITAANGVAAGSNYRASALDRLDAITGGTASVA